MRFFAGPRARAREGVENRPGPPKTAPEGSSGPGLAGFYGHCDFILKHFPAPGLKTVIRVTQVSADESMGGIIGGWGAAGAIPRAQGGGGRGRCEV